MDIAAIFQWCGTIWTSYQNPFHKRPHVKSGKIGQAVSEKKAITDYTILYIYTEIPDIDFQFDFDFKIWGVATNELQ